MRLALLIVGLLLIVGEAAAAADGEAIMVVTVAHGMPASSTAMTPGDVLSEWRVIDVEAPAGEWQAVVSPLDLLFIDRALVEGHRVSIRGHSGSTEWEHTFTSGPLGVSAQPALSTSTLAGYVALSELSDADRAEEFGGLAASTTSITSAWFHAERARVLYQLGDEDSADPAFEQALASLHSSAGDDVVYESALLLRMGASQWQGGLYAAADASLERAIILLQPGDREPLMQAQALNLRGRVAAYTGEFDASLEYSQRALELQLAVNPESLDAAETLHTLGNTVFWRGDVDLAETYFNRALALRERLAQGSVDHGRSLATLGNVAWRRGDTRTAEELFLRAAEIHGAALPDTLLLAGDYTMLGHVAYDRRDFAAAERYYFQSLEITEQRYPGEETVANTLMGLGNTARRQFDLGAARAYHVRAKEIYEHFGARQRISLVLSNLGNVALDDGEFDEAERYFRDALELRTELGASGTMLTTMRYNLATIEHRRGNLDAAEASFSAALTEFRQYAPDSLRVQAALFSLGEIALAEERYDAAEERYSEALTIAAEIAPGTLYEAESLHRLGKVALARGRLPVARKLFTRAVDSFELQRAKLGGNLERRRNFAANFAYLYRDLASLLIELGEPDAALELSERYRAQLLLATLLGRAQDVDTPVPADVAGPIGQAQQQYDRALAALMRLAATDAAQAEAARSRLQAAREELELQQHRYRTLYPKRAQIDYPAALSLEELTAAVPAGLTVLSYLMTDDNVFVFVVHGDGRDSLHLERLDIDPRELEREVRTFSNLLKLRESNAAVRDARWLNASRLYDWLLAPVVEHVPADARLAIVADGALHALPFAALTTNGPGRDYPRYVLEDFRIQLLPSVQWLAVAGREGPPVAGRDVVVFADPVIAEDDWRLAPSERRMGSFAPLPAARREAESIRTRFPDARMFVGPDASESSARTLSGQRLAILHFATHAVVDVERPSESFLVLRAGDGDPFGNGFLQAREIVEDIELDAGLVVLSACSTARGRLSAGEGVTGLTSAFLYAGARSVVSTFWPVEDDSTSVLVTVFYAALSDGRSPADALRHAQLAAIEAGRRDAGVLDRVLRIFRSRAQRPGQGATHWAAFQVYGHND